MLLLPRLPRLTHPVPRPVDREHVRRAVRSARRQHRHFGQDRRVGGILQGSPCRRCRVGRGLSRWSATKAPGEVGDLRAWAGEAAGIPPWLFEACYEQAGDLAETISLLIPDSATTAEEGLAWWVEQRLLVLSSLVPAEQRSQLVETWSALGGSARFVFNKLLTGAFRVGVSEGLVVRALSQVSGVSAETVAHRLMGQWEPSAEWFRQLIGANTTDADWSRPYPFFLAHPLEAHPRHSAISATGRSSGSGTAFAVSSYGERGAPFSGAEAKSC